MTEFKTKLKAFAGDKINVTKNEFCYGKGRKHCGKRKKNAGYQHFLFPTMFSKGSSYSVFKSHNCVVKG